MKYLNDLFSPPNQLPAFDIQQRQKNLSLIVWVVIFTSLALMGVDFLFGDFTAGLIVFGLTPVCLLVVYLNRQGRFTAAGLILCTLMLVVLDLDIYDVGGLSSDLAPVAFPVIIIVGALLFDKKGIYLYSFACTFSAIFLGELAINNLLPRAVGTTDIYDILTVVILIIATGLLLWVIIENAGESLSRIKKDEFTLRVAYDLTLEGLVKAIELRDQDTEQHSQRVVDLSVRLGMVMGLNDDEILAIKRGALLHDIGKIAVPDNILLKPGPLTEDEWQVMRQHPIRAREIISTIPFLTSAMDIPYCHHENWDGSGYPRGLHGTEIPLKARIFTIVDQWEALTSDRAYRKAWPREKALAYIRENSGRIFDPDLVIVFLKLIENRQASESEPQPSQTV